MVYETLKLIGYSLLLSLVLVSPILLISLTAWSIERFTRRRK